MAIFGGVEHCTCQLCKRAREYAEKDMAWRRMYAWITPLPDSDNKILEFGMNVNEGGRLYTARRFVSRDELKGFPDLFGAILDGMVSTIDAMIV